MNKAFVREPEQSGVAHCPRCGSLGTPVSERTLATHVVSEQIHALGELAFFCPFARCEVAYFDLFERLLTIADLRQPVYPKDAGAPICGCFGLTLDDIDEDLREGAPRRVRALLAKSKSPAADCTAKSASGHCCMPEVQRYYVRRSQGQSG
ncbi:MAG TPA: hypothetical protein VFE24_07440 [Pirellulales bacterium]|jgi:hypothetical protein|nr:hypothetical protein [Pirellulales bacterium]